MSPVLRQWYKSDNKKMYKMNIEDKIGLGKSTIWKCLKNLYFIMQVSCLVAKQMLPLRIERVNFFGCLKSRGIPQIKPEKKVSHHKQNMPDHHLLSRP